MGKWKLYQLEIGGVLLPVDNLECEAQGVMEFMSDGIMTAEEFVENTEGECVLDEMIDGTWINKGSNIYEITIDGETSLEEVTFENDTFSFDEEEGDITMRIIFKRV
ncbi:MAG: lipocalin family protein [Bacteroidota bacterium]